MKLQELLNKHKDRILFVQWWVSYAIIFFEETNDITYIYHQEDWKQISVDKSLSDLLFSTPFLSLLEWDDNKCDKIWIHQYMKWWKFVEWYSIYEQYHKINLVLLDTDEERVKYIEENTI